MSSPFDDLLQVQAHDTRLDQLRHQLASLPARAERDQLVGALAATDQIIAATEADLAGLTRQQKRLDDEIETLTAKRKHEEATLYGGSVTNARALQDLQAEIEAVGRRVSTLEDQDLEIMEQIEPLETRLASLAADRSSTADDLERAELVLTAAEAELSVALDDESAARAARAENVDGSLLAEYDALRAGRGGIGVARMVGTQCGGCHLALSAVDVARIRKMGPGEVTHCEECGRLLVP